MKKYVMMSLAVVAGAFLSAENVEAEAVAPEAPKASVAAGLSLSPDEQAFAAKLSDQNRKAFVERLTDEQRRVAMNAAKASSVAGAADYMVSKLAGSEVVKADKAESSLQEAPQAQ